MGLQTDFFNTLYVWIMLLRGMEQPQGGRVDSGEDRQEGRRAARLGVPEAIGVDATGAQADARKGGPRGTGRVQGNFRSG